VYLDELPLIAEHVGYGALGTRGSLGYDAGVVLVQARHYARALSAHAPSLLVFDLGARFSAFRCSVALNDDGRDTEADFVVLADGREAAVALGVTPGEPPRTLAAGVANVQKLSLSVSTRRWACCHSLWLDPELSEDTNRWAPETIVDCLRGFEIAVPRQRTARENCVVTAVRTGQTEPLEALLASVARRSADAQLVVFTHDVDAECEQVIARYDAVQIRMRALVDAPEPRAALCASARAVQAWRFFCVESGASVESDLRPVFSALDACEPGAILVAEHSAAFAATHGALLRLEEAIRRAPGSGAWPVPFHRTLEQLDCRVPLRPEYAVWRGDRS
jgi:NPCBM/NEW2 domain